MKLFKSFAFLIVLVAVMAGCTATRRTMKEPNVLVELEKADFTLSSQVEASASTTRILSIDWARLFKKEAGEIQSGALSFNIPVIGSLLVDPTANYALYNLMKANEGYDVVFYPQYSTTVKAPILGLGFLYKTTDVTVKARLGKL
jgi:hypothetical protein